MKIKIKILLMLVFAVVGSGCSASSAPTQMADGTECKVSTHAYPWGAYADKICTDTRGNTTTTRAVSSGLYD
jgi:hypothetical protein